MSPSALRMDVTVRERNLRVDLELRPGEIVAVVGPNGAGKSSLVRTISGQLRIDAGYVDIDGNRFSGPGRHVPVHRRRVALLEQRPLLFEHLDVRANVAFGLEARGVARTEARRRADVELDAVGCADIAERRSWEISGGQAQRIALARALATDPTLILLDEPLAALDASVTPAIRALLRARLRGEGRAAVLVTHDMVDALSLADTMVVMDEGRITARGSVADLIARPRDSFLADLTGVNLLSGMATSDDSLTLPTAERVTGVAVVALTAGSPALASFAPEAVAVHSEKPTGSPRNHLAATVTGLEPRGSLVRLNAALEDGSPVAADLTLAATVDADLRPGDHVWLAVKAVQVRLYPRADLGRH